MRAIAGIDHRRIHLLAQQRRRAGLPVAHHQQIAMHRIQRAGGIQQGFALVHAGITDRHIDDISAQPFARELKTRAGAGAVFKKQIDQRAALQQVSLGFAAAIEQGVGFRQVQQIRDMRRFKTLNGEEVFAGIGHAPFLAAERQGWPDPAKALSLTPRPVLRPKLPAASRPPPPYPPKLPFCPG